MGKFLLRLLLQAAGVRSQADVSSVSSACFLSDPEIQLLNTWGLPGCCHSFITPASQLMSTFDMQIQTFPELWRVFYLCLQRLFMSH